MTEFASKQKAALAISAGRPSQSKRVVIIAMLFIVVITSNLVSTTMQSEIDEKSELSLDKEDLADAARSEVVEVLENNLIKFFTLVTEAYDVQAQKEKLSREAFKRQEDEDEAEPAATAAATIDPNIFPQISQILGAIFSGNLNITNIVDRTFGLAPDSLRNQVDGLFKLLTGQPPAKTTTTKAPPATTKKILKRRSTSSTTESDSDVENDNENEPENGNIRKVSQNVVTTTEVYKNMIRNRIKGNRTRHRNPPSRPGQQGSRPGSVALPDDDENEGENTFYALQEKLVLAAIEVEPYIRNKEAAEFREPIGEILNNFDSGKLDITQISKALPNLFQGAGKAIAVLENLGEIPKGTKDVVERAE